MPDITINVRVVGADAAKGQLAGLGNAAQSAGNKAKSASEGVLGFGKVAGAATGIMAFTNGLLGMQDAFDDVQKADLRASIATRRAGEATEKRQKIQAAMSGTLAASTKVERTNNGELQTTTERVLAYNAATGMATVQTHTANGEMQITTKTMKGQIPTLDDLKDQEDVERDAKEKATIATKEAKQAHDRLGVSIGSNALQMGLGAAAVAPLVKGLIGVAAGSGAAAASSSAAAAGIGEVGAAAAGGSVALPVLAGAAVAVGTGAILMKTNFLGARDAIGGTANAVQTTDKSMKPLGLTIDGLMKKVGILPDPFNTANKEISTGTAGIGRQINRMGVIAGEGIGFASKGIAQFTKQITSGDIGGAIDTMVGGITTGFNKLKDIGGKALFGHIIPDLEIIGQQILVWVTKLPTWLAGGAAALGEAISQWFQGLPGVIAAGLPVIGAAFGELVGGIGGWLAGGAIAVANAVKNWLFGVAGTIITGAAQLGTAFLAWITGIPGWLAGGAIAVATAVSNWVFGVAGTIITGAAQLATAFVSWVVGIPGWLAGGAIAVATAVSNWVFGVAGTIIAGATQLGTAFLAWITGIPGWLAGGAIAIGTAVSNWVIGVSRWISGGAIALASGFAAWVAGIPGWLAGGLIAIGTAISNWVVGVGRWISGGAIALASGFAAWVAGIPGWLAGGFVAIGTAISNWVTGVGRWISGGAIALASAFAGWIANIPIWLAGGLAAVGTAVSNWFTGIGANLVAGSQALSAAFANMIANIPIWFAGGATEVGNAVMAWFSDLPNKIAKIDWTGIAKAVWTGLKAAIRTIAGTAGAGILTAIGLQGGGTVVLNAQQRGAIWRLIQAAQAKIPKIAPNVPQMGGTRTASMHAPAPTYTYRIGGNTVTTTTPPTYAAVNQQLAAQPKPPARPPVGGDVTTYPKTPAGNFGGPSAATSIGGVQYYSAKGGNFLIPAQQGGSFVVTQPTRFGNLQVGEGYRPELLTLIPMTGGGALLNVVPLAGGPNRNETTGMRDGGMAYLEHFMGANFDPWHGAGNPSNPPRYGSQALDRLMAMLEIFYNRLQQNEHMTGAVRGITTAIAHQQSSQNINLMVDGQRMSTVTQKYMGTKSYGDR